MTRLRKELCVVFAFIAVLYHLIVNVGLINPSPVLSKSGYAALMLAIGLPFFLRRDVVRWITLSWVAAWLIVLFVSPSLWLIASAGFAQNVAFTFVSRGRNSGSLLYHLIASIFSNGIYAALLFVSIDQVTQARSAPWAFLSVYTLTTMSGSIFAHWLALQVERGKGAQVKVDRVAVLEEEIAKLLRITVTEGYVEQRYSNGFMVRVWVSDNVDLDSIRSKLKAMQYEPWRFKDSGNKAIAQNIAEDLCAEAVQVTRDGIGAVHYPRWS